MEAIQKSMEVMSREFNTRMAEFQKSLENPAANPSTVAALTAEFGNFKAFVILNLLSLQEQVSLMARVQDDFEMRSRRKMLLLHGVPEGKKEDTSAVTTKILAEKLEMPEITTSDVTRCQRLGKSGKDKPRSILVKFSSHQLKDKVWFAKSSLKGSGVTLSEFLTKSRHEAFMLARQHFGVSKSWTRDGFVHIITPDGAHHRVSTLVEVKQLVEAASGAAQNVAATLAKASTATAGTATATVKPKQTKRDAKKK